MGRLISVLEIETLIRSESWKHTAESLETKYRHQAVCGLQVISSGVVSDQKKRHLLY